MSRLLIVSNRLPVTASFEGGNGVLANSTGGLATGLRGVHANSRALWIGWPGVELSSEDPRRALLDERLASARLSAVHLSVEEVAGFYDGFSNGVLWPLFHSMLDRLPLRAVGWDAYVRVNERYAEAAVAPQEGMSPIVLPSRGTSRCESGVLSQLSVDGACFSVYGASR